MNTIPIFKMSHDKTDIESVVSVIDRDSHWACGPEIEEFEKRISDYIGTKYVVAFNSGTSALHASLLSYGIGKNDKIIVPSFTFVSTVNCIRFVGATPVLTDIENETLGLSIDSIQENILPNTRAIILMHYGGCPSRDTMAIKELCEDKNIILIEDAAAAFGSKIDGIMTGSLSDSAMFSFCQNKIITTMGEGGAIVTDNPIIFEKLNSIRSHGQTDNYRSIGYNWRMASPNASFGISQMRNINKYISLRNKISKYYDKRLGKIDRIRLFKVPTNFRSTHWIYTLFCDDPSGLSSFLGENFIMSKLYYPPVHRMPFSDEMIVGDMKVTNAVSDTALSLPMYPSLELNEVDIICDKIEEYMENRK